MSGVSGSFVQGYLLDTSVVSALWDAASPYHVAMRTRVAQELGTDDELMVSVVSLSEIEYGLKVTDGLSLARSDAIRLAASGWGRTLEISHHVARTCGVLRAALYRKFAIKPKDNKKRPESLIDPVTSKELGIQENDLWLYGTAVEHNLILVSRDRMFRLREVVAETYSARGEGFLDWS